MSRVIPIGSIEPSKIGSRDISGRCLKKPVTAIDRTARGLPGLKEARVLAVDRARNRELVAIGSTILDQSTATSPRNLEVSVDDDTMAPALVA